MTDIAKLIKVLSSLSEDQVNQILADVAAQEQFIENLSEENGPLKNPAIKPTKKKAVKKSTAKPTKKKVAVKKKDPYQAFLDLDIQENPTIVADSKKLNANKKRRTSNRPEVDLVVVYCRNCNKKFELPSNYPGLRNFICCIK